VESSEKLDISVPQLPESIIVFVSGPVASGKSHLMKIWAQQKERVLVHDLMAEYMGEEYEHIWSDMQNKSVRLLTERLKQNPHYFRIAYHVNGSKVQEDFFYEYASIWMLTKPRWFFVEECSEVCGYAGMAEGMENILRYARHNLLGVVASSQRIADVSKLLTSSARMIILFFTAEFRDIQAIGDRWGKDVSDAVSKLRPCLYNDAKQELIQSPECLVILKGSGYRVVSLGKKIKTTTTGEEQEHWREVFQEPPKPQERSSLEQTSGQKEQSSPESTSEVTSQN